MIRYTIRLLLLLLFLSSFTVQAFQGRLIPSPMRKIPKSVRDVFYAKKLDQKYAVSFKLYPEYLRGDFNGDGRGDHIIQVTEKSSGKFGFAIFHGRRPQSTGTDVDIIGAGQRLQGAGDDLGWSEIWRIDLDKQDEIDGGGRRIIPARRREASILIEEKKGKRYRIDWNGKGYAASKLK